MKTEKTVTKASVINTVFDLFLITVGSLCWIIAVDALIIPNHLLSPGFTGLSIIINYVLPVIPTSVAFYIINIPAIIWAWKELNKRFLVYTFFAVTLQSVLLELLKGFTFCNDDLMLIAVFAGVIGGIGNGIVIRRNGSGGGTDILGIIIKKKWGFSVGTVGLAFNVIIISLCAVIFGLEPALYTIIFIAANSLCTDKAIAGIQKRYTAIIISKYPEQIKNRIFDELHRGVTFLKGKGAFSGDQKDVIYVAINQYELAALKDIIYNIDPDVFMTLTETSEIYGHFRNRRNKEDIISAAEIETNTVKMALRPVNAPRVTATRINVIDKDHTVIDTKEISDKEPRQ